MDNIIESYIKYVENFLYLYFRILLGNKYEKKLISPFISKYINVRYYNNTIYSNEKNVVNRINKELILSAKEMMNLNPEKVDTIKNSFALFGYILYIDDILEYKNLNRLYSALFNDKNIKLEYTEEQMTEAKNAMKEFVDKRKALFKLAESSEFNLKFKRIKKNVQMVDLEQHCTISQLYSEHAINKAYDSKMVMGNRYYLTYYLLSLHVLLDIVNLDYKKEYMVKFPIELFEKTKKVNRFLKVLDEDILKEKIHLRYDYKTYVENKEIINDLMKSGFQIACDLDEYFNNDFNQLVLFSYIFIYEKYDYYDIIIDSRDRIKTKIIKD